MSKQSNPQLLEDEERPRGRSKGGGKRPFAIEWKIECPKLSVFRQLGMHKWMTWGSYKTENRRNKALAALVKKEKGAYNAKYHFRKKDK